MRQSFERGLLMTRSGHQRLPSYNHASDGVPDSVTLLFAGGAFLLL